MVTVRFSGYSSPLLISSSFPVLTFLTQSRPLAHSPAQLLPSGAIGSAVLCRPFGHPIVCLGKAWRGLLVPDLHLPCGARRPPHRPHLRPRCWYTAVCGGCCGWCVCVCCVCVCACVCVCVCVSVWVVGWPCWNRRPPSPSPSHHYAPLSCSLHTPIESRLPLPRWYRCHHHG